MYLSNLITQTFFTKIVFLFLLKLDINYTKDKITLKAFSDYLSNLQKKTERV